MKSYGYVRVSTQEQDAKGYSLPGQEEAVRKYAEFQGLDIAMVISDDASGNTDERPGLRRLRQLVDDGVVGAVIVTHPDRLARDELLALLLRREFADAGVALHFTDSGLLDEDDDSSALGDAASRMVAAFERRRIRKRAIEAKLRKAHRGEPVLTSAPYGYSLAAKSRALVVNEEEAAIVRRIFQDYMRGGTSLTRLAKELQGTPTPAERGHGGFKRTKANGLWGESTLRAILLNSTYSGHWVYRRSKVKANGRRENTTADEQVVVAVPAIVTEETQAAAIARLHQNRSNRKMQQKVDYFLSGYISCARCGLRWTGYHTHYVTKGGKQLLFRYYRCGGRLGKNSLDGKTRRCGVAPIRADKLEGFAIDYLREFFARVGNETSLYAWAADEMNKQSPDRQDEIQQRLAGVATQRQRLMAVAETAGDGASGKQLGMRLQALDDEAVGLQAEAAKLENEAGLRVTVEKVATAWAKHVSAFGVGDLAGFMAATGSLWRVYSPEDVRLVLGASLQDGVPVCLPLKAPETHRNVSAAFAAVKAA